MLRSAMETDDLEPPGDGDGAFGDTMAASREGTPVPKVPPGDPRASSSTSVLADADAAGAVCSLDDRACNEPLRPLKGAIGLDARPVDLRRNLLHERCSERSG